MPYAAVNNMRLYYEEEGSGTPLVLLNGAFGTINASRIGWNTLRPFLARRHHINHVEGRGHGRTHNPGGAHAYTLPALAADIAGLIETLGIAPAHVAGISHGGQIALEMAFSHAGVVRSVVGIGVNYANDARTSAAFQMFDPDLIERETPDRAAELARRHDPHHGEGYWRELVQWVIASETAARSYTLEDLGQITVPSLWIAGENESFFELDQVLAMKQHIPGAEILIVNHADHQPQLTHPHLVGPAIADFLDRNDEPELRLS